ncbi:hypothetical protein Trisim1_009574 [Trichoderma cf. simile WF8]
MSAMSPFSELGVAEKAIRAILKTAAKDKPVYMLNLVRYREQAEYRLDDLPEIRALPPCSGWQAFHERYAPAFLKASEGTENEVLFYGKHMGILIGEADDEWDDMILVKYRSADDFYKFITSEKYSLHAMPHRLAALEDKKWIVYEQNDV